MDLFNREDYEAVVEEMDDMINDIEKGEGVTDEELEETLYGLEIFIEKCQQIHTACKKRLKK